MKTLSKLLCCLLAILLCFSLVACKNDVPETSWESSTESETESDPNNEVSFEDTSSDVSGAPELDNNPENSEDSNVPGGDENPDNETTRKTTTSINEKGEVVTEPTTKKTTTRKTTTSIDEDGNVVTEPTTKKPTTKKPTTVKTKPGETTKKTTAGKTTTTKKTKPPRKENDVVYRNFTIKAGTSKLEDTVGSSLKGKKYTAIIWTEIEEGFEEELKAFGKEYGCSFKMDSVNFESVNDQLSKAIAAGDAYDLVRIQGSWYPRILVNGLLTPLDDAFTMKDVVTDTNTRGIDLDKSRYFGWGDKLYSITTYDDSPIYFLYYNKKILKGANDPVEIFKKNKNDWTWAKMKEIASTYNGEGGNPFWSDQSMSYKVLPLSNKVSLLKETPKSDGGTKLAASISNNTNFINSLMYMQGLNGLGNATTGINKKEKVLSPDGGSDKFDNLLNGKIAVWPSESNRYQKLYAAIKPSHAIGSASNLGVAPVPWGVNNTGTKTYAAGWLTAFAACKGSQRSAPELVAAFTKFHSTYKTANNEHPEAAAAYEKVMKQFSDWGLYRNTNYCDFGYGTTRQENMDIVLNNIEKAVAGGADITSTLKKYDDQAEGYLKDSLSAQ